MRGSRGGRGRGSPMTRPVGRGVLAARAEKREGSGEAWAESTKAQTEVSEAECRVESTVCGATDAL